MTDLLDGEETGDVYNRFDRIPALDIQKCSHINIYQHWSFRNDPISISRLSNLCSFYTLFVIVQGCDCLFLCNWYCVHVRLIFVRININQSVTVSLSRTVSETDGDFSRKLLFFSHPCELRTAHGVPLGIEHGARVQKPGAIRWSKNFSDRLNLSM